MSWTGMWNFALPCNLCLAWFFPTEHVLFYHSDGKYNLTVRSAGLTALSYLLCSRLWCRAMWHTCTDVSDKHTASVIRYTTLSGVSKTSVQFYQDTRRYYPENSHIHGMKVAENKVLIIFRHKRKRPRLNTITLYWDWRITLLMNNMRVHNYCSNKMH
jgi:hypothetical protein